MSHPIRSDLDSAVLSDLVCFRPPSERTEVEAALPGKHSGIRLQKRERSIPISHKLAE